MVIILAAQGIEILVLRRMFPKAITLSCNFHVLKYRHVKNMITTTLLTVKSKGDLKDRFKLLMYTHSEVNFDLKKKKMNFSRLQELFKLE